jgi:xanthine dehydrogenase YagS FAD-binding subunit
MYPFSYTRATTIDSAIALVAQQPQAAFVAGGTEMLNWLKDDVERHDLLVDINDLPLGTIEFGPNGLRLGGLARMSDVAAHPAIRAGYPVLVQALELGASPQIRNAGTVGGNLLQRTRCPYFRETSFPCNKRRPGSGCAARDGEHRVHAIFGASDACVATHPSDMAVALAALDAVVRIQGLSGQRTVSLTDFHLLPGDTPDRETVLEHGELVVGVDVPASPFAVRSHYLKVRERASYEFALVSAAVAVELVGGVVRSARIALGGVAAKPWRAHAAEAALLDQPFDAASISRAGAAAVAEARPLPDNAFKIPLTERTVIRALETVGGIA